MAQSVLVKDHTGKFTFLQTSKLEEVTLTGTTASAVIDVSGFGTMALKFPSAWNAADVKIQACDTSDGTFLAVHDLTGEVEITGGTDRVIIVPDIIGPLTFIKLVSSASQAASRKVGVFLSI